MTVTNYAIGITGFAPVPFTFRPVDGVADAVAIVREDGIGYIRSRIPAALPYLLALYERAGFDRDNEGDEPDGVQRIVHTGVLAYN